LLARLVALWPYLARYRRALVLGCLAIVCSVALGLVAPLVVGRAIDVLRLNFQMATLGKYAALIVAASLVQGIFSFAQRMIMVGMSRDIEFDLRNEYFAALEKQPPAFFQDHPTGDLMARATNDLPAVRMICGPAIMYLINTVLTGAGSLFFMVRVNAGLAMVAFATMPLVVLVTQFYGQRIHVLFERVQAHFASLTARAQENLAGVRVVRAYAREAHEEAAFGRVNQDYVQANRRLIGWTVSFHPLLSSIIGLAVAVVLWYGGRLVMEGRITIGQLVTFNFFLGKLVWPMIALGWVINLAQRGTASFGRFQEILLTVPAIRDLPAAAAAGDAGHGESELRGSGSGEGRGESELRGEIELRGLSFAYRPGAPVVLSGVRLHAAAGETVALVGRTGAGKSTLLSLIPRLLDPPPGALSIGRNRRPAPAAGAAAGGDRHGAAGDLPVLRHGARQHRARRARGERRGDRRGGAGGGPGGRPGGLPARPGHHGGRTRPHPLRRPEAAGGPGASAAAPAAHPAARRLPVGGRHPHRGADPAQPAAGLRRPYRAAGLAPHLDGQGCRPDPGPRRRRGARARHPCAAARRGRPVCRSAPAPAARRGAGGGVRRSLA
jgi:ABC-type multidrug transport system fused ATPase/permease subunit